MKILDIDLDYFMDKPVYEKNPNSKQRITDPEIIAGIWEEERVIDFLENHLGLSKNKKIKGKMVTGHNEALFFLQDLYKNKALDVPFTIVHVDSHADLGFACRGWTYVLTVLINVDHTMRHYIQNYEYNGEYYKIDIGNYLLFAIAFRWVKELFYCANVNGDVGDIPRQIISREISKNEELPAKRIIKLKPIDNLCNVSGDSNEPEVPLTVLGEKEMIKFNGDFDYIIVAQSPNYTPKESDKILDILKEYINEI